MSRRDSGLALASYAAATFFAFPQPLLGGVLDLGVVLAWVAPALLVRGVEARRPARAARFAFAAGLLAHAAVLHWIYVVTVTYGHAPAAVGVIAPVLLASYVALHTAGFGAGYAWLARRGLGTPLAAAVLWTILDHLRSFSLTGFPWATLGYAQHHNAALMPWVAWTGVYGLSFASVLGGVAALHAIRDLRARRRPAPGVLASLGAVLALHGVGLGLGARVPDAPGATLRVAVLQGNIDQGVKWSPGWVDRTVAIYEDLTRRAVARGARLVVWPETAVPGGLDGAADTRARLAALARETGAALVVGAVGLDTDAIGQPLAFYDSAYLVQPSGAFTDRYDKSHLVPFGEYVPLRSLLGLFLSAVARGIAAVDVTAGPGPRRVELDLRAPEQGSPGAPAGVAAGVPICFELLFPDLVRRFVADGASLLLAITNDAWYGRTGAPYQFLAMTAMRSAETRVWTARAANTGVSAFIDPRGRVRARTRIFERALLVQDVPLRPAPTGGSFYTRHGDWFAGACWLSCAALLLVARLRSA